MACILIHYLDKALPMTYNRQSLSWARVVLLHSLAQLLTHSLTHSLCHSLVTQSLTQSLTHPVTHSLTHSLARSLARSLAHSLTHSLTHKDSIVAYASLGSKLQKHRLSRIRYVSLGLLGLSHACSLWFSSILSHDHPTNAQNFYFGFLWVRNAMAESIAPSYEI